MKTAGKRGFFNFIRGVIFTLCVVFTSAPSWAVQYYCGKGGNFPMKFAGCKPGYYYANLPVSNPNSITPENVSDCFACPPDKVCSGGFNAPVDQSSTVTCAAGYYLPKNSYTCTVCPAGKYCAGGTFSYSNRKNQGLTGDVAAGYFCSSGCTSATPNTTLGGQSGTGSNGCLVGYRCGLVSAGYFSTGGGISATPNNTVGGQSGTGENGCISDKSCGLVSAGFFSTGGGTKAAPEGNYMGGMQGCVGGQTCGKISGGYYNTGGGVTATPGNSAGCVQRIGLSCGTISAGYYSSGGGTAAAPTSSGCVSDGVSANTCGQVSGGYYSTGGGTSATPTSAGNGCISGKTCGKVATGYYSSGGGKTSTPDSSGCVSGKTCGACSTFRSNTTTDGSGKTSTSDCLCANGKYLSGSSCVNTSAGYYSGVSNTQTACGAGKYSTAGSSSCSNVNAGYFCTGGCTSATPNTYVGGRDGDGSNGCISGKRCGLISGGYYGGAGATTNQGTGEIAQGYYSSGGATTSTPSSSNCNGKTCGACMSTYTTASTGATSPNQCYKTSTTTCANVKPYPSISVSNGAISYVKADGTATSASATIDAIQYQANASTAGPVQAKNPWQCVVGGVTCNTGYVEFLESGHVNATYGITSSSSGYSWNYTVGYDSNGYGMGQAQISFNSGNTTLYVQAVIASDFIQTAGSTKTDVTPTVGSSGSCWCRLTGAVHNGTYSAFKSQWVSASANSETLTGCTSTCGGSIYYGSNDVRNTIIGDTSARATCAATSSYTHTLNNNNGSGVSPTTVYTRYGEGVYSTLDGAQNMTSSLKITSIITKPTRAGYTFKGFYSSTSGGTQYVDANGNFTAAAKNSSESTWYAQWNQLYTLTLDKNGGSGGLSAIYFNSGSVQYSNNTGTTVINWPISVPTRTGYTFAGYVVSGTGATLINANGYDDSNGNYFGTIASSQTAYAQWSIRTNLSCDPGEYMPAGSVTCTTCPNGSYCPGFTNATFNSDSPIGLNSCPSLTSGYSYVSGTGWTSYSNCKETKAAVSVSINCYSGALTKTASSSSAWGTAVSTLTAKAGYKTSGSGDDATCSACGDGYYSANGNDGTCDACPTADSGWTATTGTTTATAYSACYEKKVGSAISSYCNAGELRRAASSASAYSSTVTIATALKAVKGAYVNSQTCSQCTGATYQDTDGSTATSCSACPDQTSGWTRGTGTGWQAVTSCYETRTPANCASGTIKHNATNSTTWGTASVTSALSSNGGYYVNGTACSQCSAGTYYGGGTATACTACTTTSGWSTTSPAGSSAYTACYQTQTPANCASGTIKRTPSSISGTTITYGTASVTSALSSNGGYYVNGTACSQCSAGTYYGGGTATACTACGAGTYSTGGASSCSNVNAGYFCTGGCTSATPNTTVGGTSGTGSNGCISGKSCGLISAGYYGGSGASSNTGTGTVSAGYYNNGGGTSATPTGSGSGCVSGRSCGGVDGGYYSTGGGTSATPTSAGNGCISGKSCGKVSTGYYNSGGGTTATPTGNSGCISGYSCGSCSNYRANTTTSGEGKTSTSDCLCTNGKYLSGASCVDASAGYYSGISNSQTACGAGTYSTGGASTCSYVSAGYFCTGGCTSATPNTTVGGTSGTGSNGCISGKSCGLIEAGAFSTGGATAASPNSTVGGVSGNGSNGCPTGYSCGLVSAGYYSNGGGTSATPSGASNGCLSGRSCGLCSAGTYSTGGATTSSCSACPSLDTDYYYKSTTGLTAITQCEERKLPTNCYSGYIAKVSNSNGVWQSGSGSSLTAKAGYKVGSDYTTCVPCGDGYYSANGNDGTCDACPTADSGWTATTGTTTATAYSACYEKKVGSAISSYCNAGELRRAASSASAYSSTVTIATALKAVKGAYVNSQTCSQCTGATYQDTDGSTATSCSACPTAETNWTQGTGTGWQAVTSCYETRNATAISSNCSAGVAKKFATNSTTWGTASASTAFQAKAGSFVDGLSCTQCATGSYTASAGTQTSCTVCGSGTTTSGAGKTSCDATCSNNNAYDHAWATPSWNNNSPTGLCKITSCKAGSYYTSTNSGNTNTCTACADGSYMASNGHTTTACSLCSALTGVSPSGGTYSTGGNTGSTANTACKYLAPNKTITGCKTVTSQTVTYSGSAWPASTYGVTASKGYVIANNNKSNATCTQCTSGGYQATDGSTATSCTLCSDLGYPTGFTSGGTFSSVSPFNASSTCRYKPVDISKPSNCASVTTNTVSYTGSAWNTDFYTVTANAGSYITANNQKSPTCGLCPTGSYTASAGNQTSCTVCGSADATKGKTTSGTGKTSCDATCSNNNKVASWTTASWSSGAPANVCKVATCGAGSSYSSSGSGSCTNCTDGTYMASTSHTNTSCSACSALTAPSVTGGTFSTGGNTGSTTNTACRYVAPNKDKPANCDTISKNTVSYNGSAWGTNFYTVTTVAGRYITANNNATPTCALADKGYYVAGTNKTAQTLCAAGSYTSSTGQSSCTACQNGTTNAGTNGTTQQTCGTTCSNATGVRSNSDGWETATWSANSVTNACTIKSTGCSANYYKNSNACSTCSSGTNSKYTLSATGTTTVNNCYLNTTAGKYITSGNVGTGTQSDCTAGSYCPSTVIYYGGTYSSNHLTYGGISGCPTAYPSSATGADKIGKCYLTLTAGQKVQSAGAGAANCDAGKYCTSTSKIYYNTDGGTATYTGTACSTLGGGLYTNSAAGSSAATSCYITIAEKKYLAAQSSTSVSDCTAGNYCAGGNFYYSSTATNQGLTQCPANSYCVAKSAAATACSTLASGGYPSSNGGSDEAADCYKAITLNKNGWSGSITAVSNGGCEIESNSGSTAATLRLHYNTACSLPSGESTQAPYVFNGLSTSSNIGGTQVSSIAASTSAPTVTTYYIRKTGCSSSNYKSADATCSACSGLASGFYPNSTNNNSNGSAACYTNSIEGQYVAKNATSATNCGSADKYKASHTVNYGSSSSCSTVDTGYYSTGGTSASNRTGQTKCEAGNYCVSGVKAACSGSTQYQNETGKTSCKDVSGGYYKSSNSAQTQCPANYQSGAGAATQAGCTASCSAGYAVQSTNGACTAITTNSKYTSDHTVTYGNTSTLSSCNTTNGYTNSGTSASDHANEGSCKTTCSAGYAVLGAREACTSIQNATYKGKYIGQNTVSQGSTTSISTCPTNYQEANGTTAQSNCETTCSAGYAVQSANSACSAVTTANKYASKHNVKYGNTSTLGDCLTAKGYSNSGNLPRDHADERSCLTRCDAGSAVLSAREACTSIQNATYKGKYIERHYVGQGGKSTIDTCPTNYQEANGTTAQSNCETTCSAGTQVASANAACSTPKGTTWYSGQHNVKYGSTSGSNVKSCATGYATADTSTSTDHDQQADCKISCDAGYYIPTAGGGCQVCTAGKYCSAISGIAETSTSAVTGNITAGYFGNGGTKVATPTSSDCLSGYTCGTCQEQRGTNGRPLYTDAGGGASACSECPAVSDELISRVRSYGYYPSTRNRGISGCLATFYDSDDAATFTTTCYRGGGTYGDSNSECHTNVPTECAAGKYNTITQNPEWRYAGDEAATCRGVDCMKGRVCTNTTAGYYSAEGALTQTACAAGSYSSAGASTCTACPAGKTTSGTGTAFSTDANTTCSTSCSAITNLNTWNTQTWNSSNNSVTNLCTVATCKAGAYKSGNTCPVCGDNKYSSAGATSCTSCNTTNGYTNSGTSASDHAGQSSCKTTCSAGNWVASNGAACSSVGDGYYSTASQTIAEGSTGSRSACSVLNSDYIHSDSGRDATTDCFLNTTLKKYVATAKANQVDCATNGYCPGSVKVYYNSVGGRTACGTGLFAPAKAYREEQCGHKMHVDGVNFNDVVYLHSDKVTTPSFNVRWNNKTWYANMTQIPTNMNVNSTHKFKASYGGNTYYVCDDTTCDPNHP